MKWPENQMHCDHIIKSTQQNYTDHDGVPPLCVCLTRHIAPSNGVGITLHGGSAGRAGGPCCQMKNMNFLRTGELHRRAERQAAPQDEPAGCTLKQSDWLHIRVGYGKRRAGELPFSAAPRPFPQPAGPSVCAAHRLALLSSVQPAENSRFSFGNTALQLARPQLSVVPDPDFRSLGSGFLDNFLDPEPDWISFLLKPDPDTDYPKRYAWNTFYFLTF